MVCLKLSALSCPLESLCTVSYWYSEPWLEDCQASPFNSWHLERPVCQTHWLCEVATILNPILQMMELMPRELTWLVHSVTPVSGQQEGKPRPWGASAQARDHCDFQCLKKKKNSGRADLGIWEENFCSCKIVNGWEAKKNNFFFSVSVNKLYMC